MMLPTAATPIRVTRTAVRKVLMTAPAMLTAPAAAAHHDRQAESR